jgi:hypothetical protein
MGSARLAHRIAAHGAEIAFPETLALKLKDLPRPGPEHEVLQRPADRPGVRALPAESDRLLEQLRIEHKIRTFHV